FLEKSHELLEQAETMLRVDLHEAAGRTAYLAGFHAAQALIFERDDRVLKTHRGVQRELGRLVKDDAGFDIELRAFLSRTYNLKAIADYESGPGSKISQAQPPKRSPSAVVSSPESKS
ncbi:MAG: HEPN domain-containing protein, partial [Roseiarcus sp.]